MALNGNKNTKAPRRLTARGEAVLADVAALVIRLENGETHEFDVAAECAIPADLNELAAAARTAPARQAFWAHQAARAARDAARAADYLRVVAADANGPARQCVEGERPGERVSEWAVTAVVETIKEVVEARKGLADLQCLAAQLQSLSDATRNRVFVINRLLDQYGQGPRTG